MAIDPRKMKYKKADRTRIGTAQPEAFIDNVPANKSPAPKKTRMESVVSIKFPKEMLERIDAEANDINIPRTSWIRMSLSRTLAQLDQDREEATSREND